MAISPLLSLAGTALAPLARDVVEQITDMVSFDKLLGGTDPSTARAGGENHLGQAGQDPAVTLSNSQAGTSQLETIRSQPLQALESFVERLRERLSAAGIDLATTIPLKVGQGGDIHVDGNHPDRAAIEELLAADAQLSSTFRQIANAFVAQDQAASGSELPRDFRLTLDAADFSLAFE